MAKYLILIYGQESDAAPTPDQWDWMMKAHGQFAQAVDQQGGKILGGEALQPTATATSVRNDGQAVTDGPFVETKGLGRLLPDRGRRPGSGPGLCQAVPRSRRRG